MYLYEPVTAETPAVLRIISNLLYLIRVSSIVIFNYVLIRFEGLFKIRSSVQDTVVLGNYFERSTCLGNLHLRVPLSYSKGLHLQTVQRDILYPTDPRYRVWTLGS